ncbi:MAG: type IX secretion system protein PorQ [Flavobacteriaceae bacterium]
MIKKPLFIFFLLCNLWGFGQVGGQSVYQFMNMMTSPRQAALGGKVITIYDYDVNQAIFNPATINPDMDNQLAANYGNYFGEVSYGTGAYAYTWDRHVQTFHAGVSYVNYGNFEGRDEYGNLTGDFTGSEAALSFGYAYNIPWTDIYLGTNLKLISSTLESYHSFGAAIDVGAIYIDEDNDINIALAIRNVGMQITTYAGTNEKLPLEIIAGISQELDHVPIRWHLTLENLQQWNVAFSNPVHSEQGFDGGVSEDKPSFINNALRHVIFGVELFPQKSFNIRLGYNFRRSQELVMEDQRTFAGLSAGIGLKMGNLRFNYSYSRFTLAGNTSLFGLMINLQ